MPPATHLGIPLIKETFPLQHHVGVRYWQLNKKGELDAPIGSGIWMPGLNKGLCSTKHCKYTNCSCGCYCFHYDKKSLSVGHYFNLKTATPNAGPNTGVVGGIAYWMPNQTPQVNVIMRGKFGAVAALTVPDGASKSHRKLIEKAAERYQVQIVKPEEIGDAVNEWVDNVLPNFFDPPLRPLFDILGRELSTRPANEKRWSVVPQEDDLSPLIIGKTEHALSGGNDMHNPTLVSL